MRLPFADRIARALDARTSTQRTAWVVFAVAAVAVAAALRVAAPLGESIARTRDDVARNRMILDIARSRSAEAETLARAQPSVRSSDARAAIDRVLDREGVPHAAANDVGGGAVRVVLPQVAFDTLVRALAALATEEGVHVVEASIIARVEPGVVRAEIALVR
jgi:type II secretory pathway component PulM